MQEFGHTPNQNSFLGAFYENQVLKTNWTNFIKKWVDWNIKGQDCVSDVFSLKQIPQLNNVPFQVNNWKDLLKTKIKPGPKL